MTQDHQRPAKTHPRGHCWMVVTHSNDPVATIQRLETPEQCRQWLAKLNEMDAPDEYKQAVSERYQEVQ